ncbi:MAG TPA: ABC transporter ATP-binding protein [Planctomycetota bacterium]|nr:ABC transporter ATP-binding protein [Planctomycetota bacterium]
MAESEAVLDVRHVSRSFGALRAVNGLSFTLGRGQVCGFVGPNGAGKTTTMRILATLDLPDAGDALVEGCSVLADPRGVRRRVGFMSDQFVPYPNLDVEQYLDFFARAYGLRGEERRRRVRDLAGFCGLDTFLDRPVSGLSKGMGQRLHLAKTLLHDPVLLVLDEPTAGLDPHARIEFRELVLALAQRGKSVLVSSHILSELAEVCDWVLVIERGQQVVAGAIEAVGRDLQQGSLRVAWRVLADAEGAERFLLVQPHVEGVSRDGSRVRFGFTGDEAALAALLARGAAEGLALVECRLEEAGLEDIFLKVTQGRLQ